MRTLVLLAGLAVGGFAHAQSTLQNSVLPTGEWQLVRAGTLERTDEVGRAGRPTLRIEEGRFTGNTGCNGYSVNFTQRANVLNLGRIATTRRLCPSAVERALETRFLNALSRTERFTVSGPVLLLIASDRQVLSFARTR